MSQQPFDDENNDPGTGSNPDVPPEYLSDASSQESAAETRRVDSLPEVPPEYLDGNAAMYPAANEQHPLPTTDVPAEYLEQPAPTLHNETLPPPIFSATQAEMPGGATVYPASSTPAYTAPAAMPAASLPKDRSIVLLLEILPGLAGILGVGWIYAGNLTVGLILLVGYLFFIGFEILLAVFTGGIACCCLLPLNIAALAASGLFLNNYMNEHPTQFHK